MKKHLPSLAARILVIISLLLISPVLAGMANATALDDELARAEALGFSLSIPPSDPVTGAALMEILDTLVRLAAPQQFDQWAGQLSEARVYNEPIQRCDAFMMLYMAAEALGEDYMTLNGDWATVHDTIGEAGWDTYIPNAALFADIMNEISPLENCGWTRDAAAYFYAFGRISLVSEKTVFDYDAAENSMHSSEAMTAEDAALAVLRLYESAPTPSDYDIASHADALPTEQEIAEIHAAAALGIIPEEWLLDYESAATGQEFSQAVINSITLKTGALNPATANRAETLSAGDINREQAAAFVYKAVLENFFGFEDASEPFGDAFGDCFTYAITLSRYHDRLGGAIPCMEYMLGGQGELDVDIYAVGYATLQIDQYSLRTLFDVTEDGYMRIHDSMRRWEAACTAYRLYNAYLTESLLPVEAVEPMVLDDALMEQALAMQTASYDHLPYFAGTALDNKTYATGAHHTGSLYREDDFAILHELGFNYTRLMISKDLLFSFTDGLQVNMAHLNNLDEAVRWAIQYGVHITVCLQDLPGFAGASWDSAGFYDDALLDTACQAYAMLARRYRNVPNSVFSLNPFNEPWAMAGDEAAYVRGVRAVAQAIWSQSPDRLIFADCIPTQGPIESLAGDEIAQTFHWYDPDFFMTGGTVGNTPWYQAQIWPLPYVNGWLNNPKDTITLTGTFPEGTQIELLLSSGTKPGAITLLADQQLLQTLEIPQGDEDNGMHIIFEPIAALADTLTIQNAGENGLQINSVAVVFPEENSAGTPVYDSIWAQSWTSVDYRKMTVIQCMPYPDNRQENGGDLSTVEILDDGSYQNTQQSQWIVDNKVLIQQLERWDAFRRQTGVDVMVQEMGTMASMAQQGALQWLSDTTEQFSRYHFGWNLWSDVWQYLNNNRYGAALENFHGFTLERKMIQVLEPNMHPLEDK